MLAPRSGTAWLSLEQFEQRVFSQNGEDGVLARLFEILGPGSKTCVELGAGDGQQCNTRNLVENSGWKGFCFDAAAQGRVQQAWIDAENINRLLEEVGVPRRFDLLSIDLDGNDYWVWRALRYQPRVVVIEYNAGVPATEARTIPYDPRFRWDGTDYFGASLRALERLGRAKGYVLVYCESMGINAFFVARRLVDRHRLPELASLYRPPRYGMPDTGHPPDRERPWQWVD